MDASIAAPEGGVRDRRSREEWSQRAPTVRKLAAVLCSVALAASLACLAQDNERAGAQLLETFSTGADPDAPAGDRASFRGVAPAPAGQDFLYRHLYAYSGYPHPPSSSSAWGHGGAGSSENAATVARLNRITGEIRRAEMRYENIDRQRAGVKEGIARLAKEEEGLNIEAKSEHEDLMHYTAEQSAILGEMSDAASSDEETPEEEEEEAEAEEAEETEAGGEAGDAEAEGEEAEGDSEEGATGEHGAEESGPAGGEEEQAPAEDGTGAEGGVGEDEDAMQEAAREQAEDEDKEAEPEDVNAKLDAMNKRLDAIENAVRAGAEGKQASAASKLASAAVPRGPRRVQVAQQGRKSDKSLASAERLEAKHIAQAKEKQVAEAKQALALATKVVAHKAQAHGVKAHVKTAKGAFLNMDAFF